MADDTPDMPDTGSDGAAAPDGSSLPVDWGAWTNLWQVPLVVAASGMIVWGVASQYEAPEVITLSDLLDDAQRHIDRGELDEASLFLNEQVKPILNEAKAVERGRFHAIVADWIGLTQEMEAASIPENNRNIADQYAKAKEYGYRLESPQLERWAYAEIDLGNIDSAKALLESLETAAIGQEAASESWGRRNAVHRRILERAIDGRTMSLENLERSLAEYRGDGALAPHDEVWAIARQNEMWLADDQPQKVIDSLLIEMRRLDSYETPVSEVLFADLYVLLGEAYRRVGNDEYAAFQFDQAASLLPEGDAVRARAQLGKAEIIKDTGAHEEALGAFEIVVRDYVNTPSYLRGMLGRAEVVSILGQHDQAQEDYGVVVDTLKRGSARTDLTIDRVVSSLIDRHDNAVAMSNVGLALRYLTIAEDLFPIDGAPEGVLFRMAASHRQLADDLLLDAIVTRDRVTSLPILDVSPEIRYQSNELYETAGRYYQLHAQVTAGKPSLDQQWADSLFLAADSYDRAGQYTKAIEFFREYKASRSDEDRRRPEAVYRLGQAYHASHEFENAAKEYEFILETKGRSPVAPRVFVPLSRCYVQLGRIEEAEQLLRGIVRGDNAMDADGQSIVLTPESMDYRDALIELGRVQYEQGKYVEAIEQLGLALKRYPEHDDASTVEFRLGDSHRQLSRQVAAEQRDNVALSPSERRSLQARQHAYLRQALDHFDGVCRRYDKIDENKRTQSQREQSRLAHLYRGDCAFHLDEFESAVRFYDEAAREFGDHHSSMMALVQIINCYYELDDLERAATAERRARVRLQQLPEGAFDGDDSLMDRAAWERWLNNNPPGSVRQASAEGGDP